MSRYENPDVPHEVNVAKTSAAVESVRLILALVAICIAVVVTIFLGMRFTVSYIPFRYEQALADPWAARLDSAPPSPSRQYLQNLAESLAAQMNLPADIRLDIHVSETCVPNAFATLGGHITVTRGLLDRVGSENALAMVLAHEIAHIKHRDPIISAGSGIVLAILAGAVFGNSDSAPVGNSSTVLTQLHFSRSQENAADKTALAALEKHYGHTAGADGFFQEILKIENKIGTTPEFLSTHPDTRNRLRRISTHSSGHREASLTPLPDFLHQAQTEKARCDNDD